MASMNTNNRVSGALRAWSAVCSLGAWIGNSSISLKVALVVGLIPFFVAAFSFYAEPLQMRREGIESLRRLRGKEAIDYFAMSLLSSVAFFVLFWSMSTQRQPPSYRWLVVLGFSASQLGAQTWRISYARYWFD
jgi:hypothetical protein